MNRSRLFVLIMLMSLALGLAAPASAIPITAFNATITLTDPTQLGRLSRNGVPSDWSAASAFPGWINPTTPYHYSVYTIPASMFDFGTGGYAGYVQVSIDSISASSFGTAYTNSYNPTSPAATYLGDPGTSGNYFGVDPVFFQVFLPQGNDLLLVFNNTANVGVGDTLGILVEGFVDTAYTDPVVPEPASLLLLGTGLAGLVAARRRRR